MLLNRLNCFWLICTHFNQFFSKINTNYSDVCSCPKKDLLYHHFSKETWLWKIFAKYLCMFIKDICYLWRYEVFNAKIRALKGSGTRTRINLSYSFPSRCLELMIKLLTMFYCNPFCGSCVFLISQPAKK